MPTNTATRRRLKGPMSLRLRHAREDTGLGRKAFAELVGISERAVAYYEDPHYTGARKALAVRAWAEASGRDFEELFGTRERPLNRSGWLGPSAALRRAS